MCTKKIKTVSFKGHYFHISGGKLHLKCSLHFRNLC